MHQVIRLLTLPLALAGCAPVQPPAPCPDQEVTAVICPFIRERGERFDEVLARELALAGPAELQDKLDYERLKADLRRKCGAA